MIGSHAKELKEAEYNRLCERARENSSLAAREIAFRVDRERVRDQEMQGGECWYG